jgi:hypothetical protein
MISLLVLSLALSAPAEAEQMAAAPSDSIVAAAASPFLAGPETPALVEEPQAGSFDAMEIHPDTDICYKIRAYIFSTGPVPKLLRETTCGPKRATAKSVEGAKPKLVPIEVEPTPASVPER